MATEELQQACAQSTVLHLRNGDRLTGTILREETNQVTLKTTWWNVVVVPAAEITLREVLPPPGVPPAAQVAVPGTAPSPAPPVAAPAAQPKPKPPKSWIAEAQAGMDLLYSERTRQLFSGRFKLTYAHAPFRSLFDYQAAYGKTDGLTSDNRMFGSLKTDWDFANRWYGYVLGGVGYDLVRKIDLKYEIGPGLGYHVLRLTNFAFNVESGANYQTQYFTDSTEIDSYYMRFAEDVTWKITPRIMWDQKVELFPRIEDLEQYRFRIESNLRFALLENLSLIFTVLDQYDTNPAQGVPPNTLQLTSSVGFKF